MKAPSLGGRLEDVGLPELLQFLSSHDKTGRLTLSRRDGEGLVMLRGGRIVYAASSSIRESVGSILVCSGLISETTLMEALERQHWPGEEKKLGQILVEMGQVKSEDLAEVMRRQIGVVLLELARWPSGFFKFEVMEIPERGEIGVDARELLVTEGVSTDRVLFELATRLDEAGPEEAAPGPALPSDLGAPALRGEITVMLMRYAARVVKRGVLFLVRGDSLEGIAHFGTEEGGPGKVRSLRLGLDEPSLLAEVLQRKETHRGPVPPLPAHEALARQLGGGSPPEAVVIPVVMAGRAAMVFYGDNLPSREPLGPTQGLVELLTEAGLGMEKDALEERIRAFERSRRRY